MPNIFVQEPDYIGFRKVSLPLEPVGAVYDGADPYATPLGVVFNVLESSRAVEIYQPRGSRMDNGRVVYTHDLGAARYVAKRNGFEVAQLVLTEGAISEVAKNLLRAFLEAQNDKHPNGKYMIYVYE